MHYHDIKLLTEWDHTATLAALTYNLTVVVTGLASKSKVKPRSVQYFHPYRKKKREGLRITGDEESMSLLRMLGNAIARC